MNMGWAKLSVFAMECLWKQYGSSTEAVGEPSGLLSVVAKLPVRKRREIFLADLPEAFHSRSHSTRQAGSQLPNRCLLTPYNTLLIIIMGPRSMSRAIGALLRNSHLLLLRLWPLNGSRLLLPIPQRKVGN
jgi:hypothetical protein